MSNNNQSLGWVANAAQNIFNSLTFVSGDSILGTTSPRHVGAEASECPWCEGKRELQVSNWGDLHVYEPAEQKWVAYLNDNALDEQSLEFIKLCRKWKK